MKYMLLINAQLDARGDNPGCEPADWMAFDKEVQESGILVASEQLADFVTATTVRVDAEGRRVVSDGPFAESREVLGGFYVIDVPDLDAALDWAARCPGSRDGTVVVRPVAEIPG